MPTPGTGPYNYPQITISNPISPPPQQLTNVATTTSGPTITGPTDGVNNLFTYQVPFARIEVYRNGLAQTIGQDFSNGPTAVVFFPASIPQPGDLITIYGWA